MAPARSQRPTVAVSNEGREYAVRRRGTVHAIARVNLYAELAEISNGDVMNYKTIDRQTGTGSLYNSDHYICKGRYSLVARQQMVTPSSWHDSQEIPGQVEISGEIVLSEDERAKPEVLQMMQSGEILTLRLEKPFFDGRQELKVIANRRGIPPIDGNYDLLTAPQ